MWQELASINIGPKGDIRSPLGATIFFFQNGRDLDDYVREYVDKCHLATFDDLTLIEEFWCGLEDDIHFVMPRADLCWSLRNYINFALWIARSAFSVDEAETSPVSSHVDELTPVSAPVCISDLLDMALPPEFSVPTLTPESIQRRFPSSSKSPLVPSSLPQPPESPKSPLVPSSFLRLLSLRWTQPAPLLQCLHLQNLSSPARP